MKIDVTKPILNFDGKTIDNGDTPLTFRDVLGTSLNATTPDESMDVEDKSRAYTLASKVYSDDEPEFSVDELSFIKERVGKFYSPLIFGRVSDLIEGKEGE